MIYYTHRYYTVNDYHVVQHFDNGFSRVVDPHNEAEWIAEGNTPEKTSGDRFIIIVDGEPTLDPNKDAILAAEAAAAQAEAEAAQAQMDAKTGLKNLPGWATWTAEQADNWIVANLGDLTTAQQRAALITTVRAMGKAIIYLRDHARIVR